MSDRHMNQDLPLGRTRSLFAAGTAAAILLVGAASVVAAGAPDAHAAIDPKTALTVSLDGTTFTRTLAEPLFDPAFRIVPGDSLGRDFWIRNTSSESGRLRVDLINPSSNDSILAQALTISVKEHNGLGTPASTTVAAAGTCTVLHSGIIVKAGQTVQLKASVKLGGLTGKQGQNGRASFRFKATLTDLGVTPPKDSASCSIGTDGTNIPGTEGPDKPTPSPTPTKKPGDLAQTGADLAARTLGVAASSLAIGLLLVGVARRRRRAENE